MAAYLVDPRAALTAERSGVLMVACLANEKVGSRVYLMVEYLVHEKVGRKVCLKAGY